MCSVCLHSSNSRHTVTSADKNLTLVADCKYKTVSKVSPFMGYNIYQNRDTAQILFPLFHCNTRCSECNLVINILLHVLIERSGPVGLFHNKGLRLLPVFSSHSNGPWSFILPLNEMKWSWNNININFSLLQQRGLFYNGGACPLFLKYINCENQSRPKYSKSWPMEILIINITLELEVFL